MSDAEGRRGCSTQSRLGRALLCGLAVTLCGSGCAASDADDADASTGFETVAADDTSADGPGGDDGPMGSEDDGPGDSGGSGEPNPGDSSDSGGGGGPMGACADTPPAGAPTPPAPPSYSGGACPTIDPGYVSNFNSGGTSRAFAFAVPSDYDPAIEYPLVFGWYHLTGDAQGFLQDIGSQAIVDETQIIFAIPEASGNFQFVWPSTPFDNGSAGVDLTMFDDMLACISEQYAVNPNCVGSAGVSAGGLWTSYLGQQRGQYLSANVVISGGHPGDAGWWGWSSAQHKFASLVLWGGPTDELFISFHNASLNLVSEYRGDGHFLVQCEHTGGHGAPPPEVAGRPPPYNILFDFFVAHPYWLDDGNSPYLAGLPAEFPAYCSL